MLTVGFIGLGNMGSALATNLVDAGLDLVTHDLAGPDRSPAGSTFVASASEVARRAGIIVLSLPDGTASQQVARQLIDAPEGLVSHVIDTSTIGLDAARRLDTLLDAAGIAYVDAPVSGGPSGARARTLAVMVAGDPAACDVVEPVLAGLSDRRFCVGPRPGMGQAMKLANNFLSASALAAASEAIAFGTSVGLEMATMLQVLEASSGRSAATSDKFVDHVLTGRFASGFANTLMSKDVQLYLSAADAENSASSIGEVTAAIWRRFADCEPGADFTRIYPFIEGS